MTRINNNVNSLTAQINLNKNQASLTESLTRLSTGLRVNSGKDDPAGLIARESIRSEIASTSKAISNTNRANQIITTADSAIGQVSSLLRDIRGLVVEAASTGGMSANEISANQLQVDSSLEAINRIAQTTTFQGRKLIDGGLDFLTKAGTNYNKIADLQIDQANLGPTGSLKVSIAVTAAAEQAQVTVNNIPEATPGVKSAGSLALTGASATAAAATGSVGFTQTVENMAAGVLTLSDGTNGVTLALTAKTGGAASNATINFVKADLSASSGTPTANLSGGVLTVTVNDQAATDVSAIVSAIDGAGYAVSSTDIVGGMTSFNGSAAGNTGTQTAALTGGAADTVTTASLGLTAKATGIAANNATVTFTKVSGSAAPTATADTDGNLTITIGDSGTVTFSAIETAITNSTPYNASFDTTGGLTEFNNSNTITTTTTAFSGGVAGGAQASTISLTAKSTGATANGATITFDTTGTGAPSALVDSDGNITVTIEAATNVAVADIIGAINAEGTYEAEAGATDTLTSYNSTTGSASGTNFADGVAASGGLAKNVVFELGGKSGSEVFNVSEGTGIDDLITQINLVKDATGVTASKRDNNLVLTSNEYGSDAIVDLRVISEDAAGTLTARVGAGARDTGADIVAKVNGIDANGKGNRLSINTSSLDLSVQVADGSSDSVDFTITGGGALFQLGADVVSNQQARIGIGSVSSSRLGGSSGKLFQLGSGEAASLINDPNMAAKIVAEAIDQVTSLRGRLGAFQATTLESNLNSLNDSVANLTDAESTISDADFAVETAKLTRAQILVQSGTKVLQISNQGPQNVLSLLG